MIFEGSGGADPLEGAKDIFRPHVGLRKSDDDRSSLYIYCYPYPLYILLLEEGPTPSAITLFTQLIVFKFEVRKAKEEKQTVQVKQAYM